MSSKFVYPVPRRGITIVTVKELDRTAFLFDESWDNYSTLKMDLIDGDSSEIVWWQSEWVTLYLCFIDYYIYEWSPYLEVVVYSLPSLVPT